MGKVILETKELCYTYSDGTEALKSVSIQIKEGETTAILGGNGAGKSTLFLHLNGILKPLSGQVYYQDQAINYTKQNKKQLLQAVGLVFQDPDHQLFSASVFQDVSFGPLNLQLPPEVVKEKVLKALDQTGMLEFKDKPTHSLSFGQKKRVALAGVLAMEPQILVLDEPTAGLDPLGVSSLMTLLEEMQKQLNMAIVIATHDIDLVPLYCHQTYVMDRGQVVMAGKPDEIFAKPEQLRQIHLRLPRIGHLMEILKKRDHFELDSLPVTISQARRALKAYLKGRAG